MHYDGRGTEINYEKAKKYFEISYKFGNMESIYMLGVMNYYGKGIEVNYEKAKQFFEEAC